MELQTPIGHIGIPPLGASFSAEASPLRGMTVDTQKLGIGTERGFQPTVMITPEVYDFNIMATAHDSPTRQPIGLLEPIEISLFPIKEAPARVFGGTGAFGIEKFEGEATAIGLIAGAIIVTALVAGGVYASYQISKVFEFGQELLRPGLEVSKAVVEAIVPPEE